MLAWLMNLDFAGGRALLDRTPCVFVSVVYVPGSVSSAIYDPGSVSSAVYDPGSVSSEVGA